MRILIGSDLSRSSDEAMLRASSLARAADSELALCHVLPEPQLRTLFPQEHERDVEALLELQPRVADALRMQFERLLGSDAPDPTTEILDAVQALSAELLVVGTRGRSSVSRVMLGSVAANVVQRAPCSVWGVRLATG